MKKKAKRITRKRASLGGLNLLTESDKDFNLGALIKWPKLSDLPREYLIEPLSIKDQISDGNDDFCASAAGSGMIEPKEGAELFYPFLFAASKYESGDGPETWGLSTRDVGKGLTKWGVPEIKDVPLVVKRFTAEQRRDFKHYLKYPKLIEAARKHRAQSFFFVNGPYDHYDNARAAIWYFREKKQLSLFGVNWGWNLEAFNLSGTPQGFGHALWQGGWYEDGICAVNSAGRGAGKAGRHSMSRETFNYYAEKYGLLMFVDMPRDDAENYYLAHGIKLEDKEWVAFLKALLSGVSLFRRLWQ